MAKGTKLKRDQNNTKHYSIKVTRDINQGDPLTIPRLCLGMKPRTNEPGYTAK
jgi:hypothetical protein